MAAVTVGRRHHHKTALGSFSLSLSGKVARPTWHPITQTNPELPKIQRMTRRLCSDRTELEFLTRK